MMPIVFFFVWLIGAFSLYLGFVVDQAMDATDPRDTSAVLVAALVVVGVVFVLFGLIGLAAFLFGWS